MSKAKQFTNYDQMRKQSGLMSYGLQRRCDATSDLLEQVNLSPGSIVLDVGCAEGAMQSSLAERFPHVQFEGVDSSKKLCKIGVENGLSVTYADARNLPFEDGKFDVTIVSAMLKHVRDYRSVIQEVARVTKDDGHLLILDPTPVGIRLGMKLGHFDPRYICNVWNLRQLASTVEPFDFRYKVGKKYAFSLIRFPGHRLLENLCLKSGMTFTLLQQIALFQKSLPA